MRRRRRRKTVEISSTEKAVWSADSDFREMQAAMKQAGLNSFGKSKEQIVEELNGLG